LINLLRPTNAGPCDAGRLFHFPEQSADFNPRKRLSVNNNL